MHPQRIWTAYLPGRADGPEYAGRFIKELKALQIPYKLNTMVIEIKDKIVTAVSRQEGYVEYKAKAIILAMGCRERPRGALNIPGFRPAGIYSAGTRSAPGQY